MAKTRYDWSMVRMIWEGLALLLDDEMEKLAFMTVGTQDGTWQSASPYIWLWEYLITFVWSALSGQLYLRKSYINIHALMPNTSEARQSHHIYLHWYSTTVNGPIRTVPGSSKLRRFYVPLVFCVCQMNKEGKRQIIIITDDMFLTVAVPFHRRSFSSPFTPF